MEIVPVIEMVSEYFAGGSEQYRQPSSDCRINGAEATPQNKVSENVRLRLCSREKAAYIKPLIAYRFAGKLIRREDAEFGAKAYHFTNIPQSVLVAAG